MNNNPRISVLVSARKNSKYLAKFLFGLKLHTENPNNIEVLVMLNEHDTWNKELILSSSWPFRMLFIKEDLQLGRAGLHEYFNILLRHARGDWIIYFCEDHFINTDDWDGALLRLVSGADHHGDSEDKEFPLDPREPWVIVPKFDNCGSMNHMVSRGFANALGGKIGNHGWIDSYINDLMVDFGDRVIRMDESLFHDFTHDQPNPMSDAHLQSVISTKGKSLPEYTDRAVKARRDEDAGLLRGALENLR